MPSLYMIDNQSLLTGFSTQEQKQLNSLNPDLCIVSLSEISAKVKTILRKWAPSRACITVMTFRSAISHMYPAFASLNEKSWSIKSLWSYKLLAQTCRYSSTVLTSTTMHSLLIFCRNVQLIFCSKKVVLSRCQWGNSAGILTGSCHGNRRLLPNCAAIGRAAKSRSSF